MRTTFTAVISAAIISSAAIALPSAAVAADPAPDRTKPVITGFKVTPKLACSDYMGPAAVRRQVSFTLSEAARVRLIKQPLLFGFIPLPASGVTIPLAAGSHTLWSAAESGGLTEPGIFPFVNETLQAGVFGLEAKDAAGNKGSTKWSALLSTGSGGHGGVGGTGGCA